MRLPLTCVTNLPSCNVLDQDVFALTVVMRIDAPLCWMTSTDALQYFRKTFRMTHGTSASCTSIEKWRCGACCSRILSRFNNMRAWALQHSFQTLRKQ